MPKENFASKTIKKPVAVYAGLTENSPAPGIAILEAAGWEVRIADSADPAAVLSIAPEAKALLSSTDFVSDELISGLEELKIVSTTSVGVDMIDLSACRRRGIVVANVPAASTEEVATHALALILSLVRGIAVYDRDAKLGSWQPEAAGPLARLSDLRLGIIGLGRIGRKLAEISTHLFQEINGYDPTDFPTTGITRLDLETLLRHSDVISLHLPSTTETHHLLNTETLALLPRGAIVINVSRGALIDETALLAALDSGAISAAGLDVFEVEPPSHNSQIRAHPHVLATPHIAYRSPASAVDYKVHQAENVVSFWRNGKPRYPVDIYE